VGWRRGWVEKFGEKVEIGLERTALELPRTAEALHTAEYRLYQESLRRENAYVHAVYHRAVCGGWGREEGEAIGLLT